jgi:hypothetical protein
MFGGESEDQERPTMPGGFDGMGGDGPEVPMFGGSSEGDPKLPFMQDNREKDSEDTNQPPWMF